MTRPTTSYLVCATQRSGSTLLCRALARTGVAGQPDEYFEGLRDTNLPRAPREWFRGLGEGPDADVGEAIERLSPRWGPPHTRAMRELAASATYAEYLDWVLAHGTSPNGVFGSKMMWSYLHDFAARASEDPPRGDLTVAELLDEVFPSLRYVWVTRRDKVRQAVSMWKAVQTEHWTGEDSDGERGRVPGEPVFSYEAIDHLKRLMAGHDAAWCGFFFSNGIQPLAVVYEEFEENYELALGRVLDHLGVRPEAGELPAPPTPRQADSLSEEWIARFRSMDEQRAMSARGPRRPMPLRLTQADALWWVPDAPERRPREQPPRRLPAPAGAPPVPRPA